MRFLVFFVALLISLSVLAAQPAGPSADQQESSQQARAEKMQAQLEAVDREVVILKEVTDHRLDAQDERIGDLGTLADQQGNHMSAIANVTTWVGVGIALLAILAGFVNFLTVKNKATEVAEHWFEKHAVILQNEVNHLKGEAHMLKAQVNTLRQQADDAHAEIERIKVEVNDHAKQSHMTMDQATQSVISSAGIGQKKQPIDPAAVDAVEQANRALDFKPASAFTSDDHFARGMLEYLAKNFTSALSSFDKAIEIAQAVTAPAIRIAKFMLFRGAVLFELGRLDETVAAFDMVDQHYGNDPDLDLRKQVAIALFNKGITLGKLNRYEEEIEVYVRIDLRYGSTPDLALRETVAMALVNKGFALGNLDRCMDEIEVYNLVEQRYGKDSVPAMRKQIAKSLFNKGGTLRRMKRYEEALETYNVIDKRYGTDTNEALREQIAMALVNKGATLGLIKRHADEIGVYDLIDQRYSSDPNLREQVAMALFNKGVALGLLENHKEEIEVYQLVDQRYSSDPTPSVRKQVAMAMVNRGFALGLLERHIEEVEVYALVDQRYGSDPALRESVIRALVNQGVALGQLKSYQEEIEIYDIVDQRYGKDSDQFLREKIAKALNGRAFAHIMLTKQHWNIEAKHKNRLTLAIDDLRRAQSQCTSDDLASILGNLGYALFLRGDNEEAEMHTRECLQLGQEDILSAQREDARMHRVEPQDTDYERLLDQLWKQVSSQA